MKPGTCSNLLALTLRRGKLRKSSARGSSECRVTTQRLKLHPFLSNEVTNIAELFGGRKGRKGNGVENKIRC